MPGKGSCLCKQSTYSYSGDPEKTALCHCTDCQKWTGGAFTSNVVVKEENFTTTGDTKRIQSYDATGESGKINKHFFCNNCGSSLFTRLDIMPGTVVIKAGGLDDGGAALNNNVEVEFYVKDRMPYLSSAGAAEQMPAFI